MSKKPRRSPRQTRRGSSTAKRGGKRSPIAKRAGGRSTTAKRGGVGRKAPAKRTRSPRQRCRCELCKALSAPAALRSMRLGQVVRIEYIHENGRRYRHEFKTPASLLAIDHGAALVITPVTLTRVSGDHFIGD